MFYGSSHPVPYLTVSYSAGCGRRWKAQRQNLYQQLKPKIVRESCGWATNNPVFASRRFGIQRNTTGSPGAGAGDLDFFQHKPEAMDEDTERERGESHGQRELSKSGAPLVAGSATDGLMLHKSSSAICSMPTGSTRVMIKELMWVSAPPRLWPLSRI